MTSSHDRTRLRADIRRLFGRREDPFAGLDMARARRLGGALWAVSTLFGFVLLPLSPPTAAIGTYGWAVFGALVVVALLSTHRMVSRKNPVSVNELYAFGFAGLANIALVEWLAGGHGTPWHNFYLLAVLFTAAVQPPRRVVAFLAAYVATTSLTAFHSGGWNSVQFGDVVMSTVLVLGIGVLAMVLMDGIRAQRATLQRDHDHAHHLANVDSLTNLGNRRKLMSDLEAALPTASEESPASVALYDLDGFKSYNDSFGHQAGDALLIRLAERLAAALPADAAAYRMGGDEFCVIAHGSYDEAEAIVARAREALSERGEGFDIQASFGWKFVTDPKATPSDALRAADRAMYARKTLSRASAGRQSTDVLLSALAERSSDLGVHVHDVRDLCESVADELGLSPELKAPVLQAASLHDVGKVAIPDEILNKPGPLTDEEWDFMRRHTIVGERILTAAPALVDAAPLVRSSHERFDGWGYPDGLKAEDIPLGARIIAVCDAFDAMVSPRPYRTQVSPAEAIRELRACAGTQFDPVVVQAFCSVYDARVRVGARVTA